MNHTCTLKLRVRSPENVMRSIRPEVENYRSERAKTRVGTEGDMLIVEIEAKDINGMRATINSVLRTIMLSEKIMKGD